MLGARLQFTPFRTKIRRALFALFIETLLISLSETPQLSKLALFAPESAQRAFRDLRLTVRNYTSAFYALLPTAGHGSCSVPHVLPVFRIVLCCLLCGQAARRTPCGNCAAGGPTGAFLISFDLAKDSCCAFVYQPRAVHAVA